MQANPVVKQHHPGPCLLLIDLPAFGAKLMIKMENIQARWTSIHFTSVTERIAKP